MMVTQKLELPNFYLRSCIGKACHGLANVYLAQDKKDVKKLAAIRVCVLDQTAISIDSLVHEISVLRDLKHVNVLSIQSCFLVDSSLCITMPLSDYGSVTDVIHARFIFGLPELAIAHILRDIIAALEYVHSMHYLHRAVRCSHMLLSSQGRCRLSGFRHATKINRSGTRTGTLHEFLPSFQSNLLWLAPEVLQQDIDGYGTKSDVYSLGIAACEAANGFPPFADMEHMQMLYEKMRGTTPRLLDCLTLPPFDGSVMTSSDDDADATLHREQRSRRFSDAFHDFTDAALRARPEDRWTLEGLAAHPFLKQLKKSRQSLSELIHPVKAITSPTVPSTSSPFDDSTALKSATAVGSDATGGSAPWQF